MSTDSPDHEPARLRSLAPACGAAGVTLVLSASATHWILQGGPFPPWTAAGWYVASALLALVAGLSVNAGRRAAQARRSTAALAAARQAAALAEERERAAVRDKSRFLGMLSHEMLTPLQSIISSMDIIESRGRVESGEPLFLRLREGTRSLRARLSDLVDFAKMSAGSLTVNPRRFRLDRLVEEVIAEHEETMIRKDLDIHWEPGVELRQPIVTDPRRVRQVLDNLVSNALKYTERGGVTIEACIDPAERRLSLEVRDTGIGIAPADRSRIWEPFYRVPTSAAMAEGSGLGLAVVRSLVDLLQGEVHLDTTAGSGTRVQVWIPVTLPVSQDRGPATPQRLPEVLVVDDAHDVRAGVAEVLRSLGHQPAEAGSGREALRVLDQRPFQVVLLDLELPDLSGAEVARRVKEGHGPNRDTPLVMVSAAHEVTAEAERWFDARLDKPVAAGQLRHLLASVPATRTA